MEKEVKALIDLFLLPPEEKMKLLFILKLIEG